jgi:MFS family permease
VTAALRRSVSSLSVPNYRRYFLGQVVSVSGNWMQIVAEVWLILKLTGSGTAVGLVAALQFLPILLFGAFGGMLADRVPKRTLLQLTQAAMVVPALSLFALYATGVVEPWMVFALVLLRGTINAIDNPARQSFAIEMVGPGLVVNAVSLNSVIVHASRIAGPAVAGVVISVWGVGPCFVVNAASFAAMIVALRAMDPARLDAAPVMPREKGALRAALRYVWSTPPLRVPLLMMALVGTLSFNFIVLLPLLARFSFDGAASSYAGLMTAMGVGSVLGALVAGARGRVSNRLLTVSSAAFGGFILLLAVAPTIELAALVLVPLGAASVTFAAGVNSALQLAVAPEMRGRVMALYSMVFLGSTPIGGPLSGWLAEAWSPRVALLVGGAAALLAAIGARAAFARAARRPVVSDEPCGDARPRRARPGSSRPSHPDRSSRSGSSRGTAGGSPPRSRTAPPSRSPS